MTNQRRYTIRCLMSINHATHKLLTIFNVLPYLIFFQEVYCTESICTVFTRVNCKIVPVTNFNKYLPYSTSKSEYYCINIGAK
jgi:hypothetical protein